MTYQTFECEACGAEFKALGDSNAGEDGFCSPACAASVKGFS